MGERKVLNKYFPPDFDPAKVPFGRVSGGGQHKVRLMAPFSMRCATCGNYIYKGTKFNARKEICWGEEYLGIVTYRFYIRCPVCASELTFKTDPKNADYVSEHGITRNFEAWREEKIANDEISFRKTKEEELDPMKALENKTYDSKIQIEVLEMLDEVRTRNARHEKVDADLALDYIGEREKKEKEAEESKKRAIELEDEEIVKRIFNTKTEDGILKRRLLDSEVSGSNLSIKKTKATANQNQKKQQPKLVKKKPEITETGKPKATLLGIGDYSDSD